ncbi:MAG: quinone-dependent dihydroorotate dehydrogenase [Propionibacteriales bacterium]|nr:quinone-dependent dihydroorotate dehydrogenase [Propionibacteriales bacterium]
MISPYRALFDRVLTKVDPEKAHHAGFAGIRAAGPALRGAARILPEPTAVRVMGLDFPGVLGLAAGFDKNAVGIDALGALGFGFVEVGTVTGEPQAGNPKPRLLRLPDDRAVVNRMGFNNDGAEVVAARLARRERLLRRRAGVAGGARSASSPFVGSPVLGVNIGKTKVVAEEDAVADYEKSTGLLAPYADYLVVNVSSPNTPGLRDLQAVEKLEPLLKAVRVRADQVTADRGTRIPLLVKIAPDLSDEDVLAVADLATALGLDGIIATNTTIARTGLRSSADAIERAGAGGLSGEPLRKRSLAVLRLLRSQVGPGTTLIGVGGIAGVEDAVERLAAGADLLQAYTAFIYEGPLWPRRINAAIAKEQRR